jgi:type I restriction enzyme S subunit
MTTKIKKISEVVTYVKRGIAPAYTEDEDGIVIINQKCIRDSRCDFSKARKNDIKQKKIPSEKFVKENDILINSTGVGTLGRVCQIREVLFPFSVDTHVTIVRPDPGEIDAVFLGIFLCSVESQVENLGEGSTGQTELYADVILDLEVLIPDLHSQRMISRMLGNLDALVESKYKEIDALIDLKHRLAPAILAGDFSEGKKKWRW